MERILGGRAIVAGRAEGEAIVSREPLSFWGGFDPQTGAIIDRYHDRCGESIAGRVFVFPQEKGSCTGSAVLLESVRLGKAPAAIISHQVNPILALGSIVAEQLYNKAVPVLVLPMEEWETIIDGDYLLIQTDGKVRMGKK
ncbi:hypothetical protein DRJ12_03190 [Candidatus Acetothermia bacterium]|nr:MAG: hypothetical protein DRJ12_03190 [Candidatus Acetothermia bacterium]